MIVIVRHGETVWNTQKRKQGHKNSKLTKKGKKQAIKVAQFFNKKNFDLNNFTIYSSPLKRVIDYSKIINKNLLNKIEAKKKIKFSSKIKEHKFGNWEGKNDVEISKKYPEQVIKRAKDRWNYKIPGGGESYKLLNSRVKKFLNKISLKDNILIITHDMVSRVIRGNLMKYTQKKIMSAEHKNNHIYIYNKKKIKKIILK